DYLNGPQKVLVICQRLSHPHEHDVIDLFSAQSLNLQNLFNNFPGLQISRPPVEPARAELASIGAANLGRDTQGSPVGRRAIKSRTGRYQDRLDERVVLEAKKK